MTTTLQTRAGNGGGGGSGGVSWSEAERGLVARELANAIAGEVRFDAHNRMLYATDASLYQVEPLGVVIPASVEDAVAAVRFCAARGLPILPRGGGTSLAGQCTNRAVVIDFSVNCRRVGDVKIGERHSRDRGVDAAGLVDVEPGITPDDLNDMIAATGLFFAPDPATSRHCNVGGCIGNNAAGARSIRYKRTSENVEAVKVCLADGTVVEFSLGAALRDARVREITQRVVDVVARHASLIRERFPKTLRRSAGYQLDVILKQMEGAGWNDGRPAGTAGPPTSGVTDDVLGAINLSHLLCGSEGTLAVTLGATLKLQPKPKAKALVTLGFSSLDASIERVVPILSTGPTAVELLDDTVVDLALANAEYRAYAEMMPKPADGGALKAVLYVEYFGQSEAEVREAVESLRRVVPGVSMDVYTDASSQLKAWKLRKAGEPLLHGIPGNRKPITFVEDNAVPVENLAAFVKEFRAMVAEHGTIAAYYAHASVGVLHIRPLIDIHTEDDRTRMRSIATKAAALAKQFGGVMSGEHGDGRVRTPFLEDYYGPELMAAFREIKRIFDPRNLLNPGNIVDFTGENPRPIESITTRLRVLREGGGGEGGEESNIAARPVVIDPSINTFYDYHDQHGFDAAVEMCNGSGVCRKKQGGTMCPSYMGTLDERHSTRGRGNALRLAITGQLRLEASPGSVAADWNDAGTIETLNLCLSCKACKTECPSNVDIARLKSEYTAQRYREYGTPWQTRFFGSIRLLNRLGAMTPGVANWVNSTKIARWVANTALGLHPKRSLPAFATSLARSWGRGQRVERDKDKALAGASGSSRQSASRRVFFFGDCFSMFNEPGIGLASKRVYEAFGYRVDLADAGCCGRAKISLGMLPEAIDEIDATIEKLRPLVEDERIAAILVAEPSCLSAMKDDWLTLKLRTPIEFRKRLSAKVFLPEDFLHKQWELHPLRPTFRSDAGERGREVLLHGHCHQKALWGAETSAALLRRVAPSLKVLDTGCCGMAGAFGYTKERYDLSMKIGDIVLFPAVRKASPGSAIIAPGTSCRHQIHDGTGVKAVHPIEFIADMLA